MKTLLVGVSGGIGSGKSRVCRFWSDHFAVPQLNVDAICRALLEQGEPGWLALRQRFGSRFFLADGSLDRPGLRRILFEDHDLRRRVDGLLHPLARAAMRRQLAPVTGPLVLVEIPLLIEAGWLDDVDRVVIVYADFVRRCRRIVARDRVDGRQAMQAIRAQMDLANKVMLADHVIDNSGCWADTCLQVMHLGRLLLEVYPGAGDATGFSCATR